MQNKKGFTLLELLVVVLIIGILAAIALPQYKMAVGKAKFATLKDNARVIKDAMDRYYLVNDLYPTKLSDLDVKISENCSIGGDIIFCTKNIFNVTMQYGIGYLRRKIKACYTFSVNLTDYSNRLCQQETGKLTPDENGGTMYKAYYY